MMRHFKESCGKVYEVPCEDCEYVAPNKAHYQNHRRKFHANESRDELEEVDDEREVLGQEGLTEVGDGHPSEKLRRMRGISIVKIEESEHDRSEKGGEREQSIPSPFSGVEDYVPSDNSAEEDLAKDVKRERTDSVTSPKPSNPNLAPEDVTEGLTEEDISSTRKKLFKLGGISCVKLGETTDELPVGREDDEQSAHGHSPASVGEDFVPSDDSADDDWADGAKRKRSVSSTGRKLGTSGYASVNLMNSAPARPKIVCGVCQKGCATSEELKSHVLSEHMNKGGPRKPGRGRKAKPVVEPIGGICDSCGKFEKDLKRHMEMEHSEAKKCHLCPFEISDQNKLNLHYLVSLY